MMGWEVVRLEERGALMGKERGSGLKKSLAHTEEWEEIQKSPKCPQLEHREGFRVPAKGGKGLDKRGDQYLLISPTKVEEISKNKRYAIIESNTPSSSSFFYLASVVKRFPIRGEKYLVRVTRKLKWTGIFHKSS